MNWFENFKWDVVRKNFLQPALARLGTIVTTWLVATGGQADLAHQVGVGVVAAGLIAFDLILDRAARKDEARKAVNKAFADTGI